MSQYKVCLFLCCFIGLAQSPATASEKPILTLFSDIWPPFQQLNLQGRLEGVAATKVKQTLTQANWPYELHVVPWARALKKVEEEPNRLIFSISRTLEREKQFQWIAPLARIQTGLVALSDRKDIRIEHPSDIKQFKLVLKRHESTSSYFYTLGFDANTDIIYVNSSLQALELLKSGRADIYPITHQGLAATLINSRFSSKEFAFVFDLPEFTMDAFLATNLMTDMALVEQLRTLFEHDEAAYKAQRYSEKKP